MNGATGSNPAVVSMCPPGKDLHFTAGGPAARIIVWQKPYRSMPGVPKPTALVHHEREMKPVPLAGNDLVRVQELLPDQPAFDMAVRLLTVPPGAALSSVATQAMEQGWCWLGGQGLVRLQEDWIPVHSGDAVWVGPYCTHWFAALGKNPARLLCYREANRDPM